MDRDRILKESPGGIPDLYYNLKSLHQVLGEEFKRQFQRSIPFGDELFDRWERAKSLGFGEGASIYESCFVFGDVKVGEKTWVGPWVMLDGSGGIEIGSYCMVSSGVHIYTHDTVKWSLTAGKKEAERKPVKIEDCCYLGAQAVIIKGVSIGHHSVIGACSFVNSDIPPHSVAFGIPARIVGRTIVNGDDASIEYFDRND